MLQVPNPLGKPNWKPEAPPIFHAPPSNQTEIAPGIIQPPKLQSTRPTPRTTTKKKERNANI